MDLPQPKSIQGPLAEKLGHSVVAHDPKVMKAQGAPFASGPYGATKGVAVVAVLNDEPAYRKLDWKRIGRLTAPGAKLYSCSASIGRIASSQMKTFTLGGAV